MKRNKPSEGNKTFCMAPWVHTYLSPQMERRLCCASLEKSTNFKQYVEKTFNNNAIRNFGDFGGMIKFKNDILARKHFTH